MINWLWVHDFEFFFQAWFIDLLFFELILKSGDVIEGSESVTFNILVAGFFETEIALFPESLLGLCLF